MSIISSCTDVRFSNTLWAHDTGLHGTDSAACSRQGLAYLSRGQNIHLNMTVDTHVLWLSSENLMVQSIRLAVPILLAKRLRCNQESLYAALSAGLCNQRSSSGALGRVAGAQDLYGVGTEFATATIRCAITILPIQQFWTLP